MRTSDGNIKRGARYWFGWLYLKLSGWKIVGTVPQEPKFVLICAPHTSNWDLPLMLAFSYLSGVQLSWLGKKAIFDGPIRGPLFRWLGGISVDRKSPQGLVEQVADVFQERDKLIVAVPPAGTRGKTDGWKTGFYYIAKSANVPISMGFLDYAKKEGGFGSVFVPTTDIEADFDVFRNYYRDKHGKFPDRRSDIRLRRSVRSSGQSDEQS